jgi:two-component system C4-dicarboxylate transport response regulator DctD
MSTPQVILVDDDQQMRSSTSQALELAGVAVRTVASGVEALALAGPGFDGTVVSDIRMPQMDGLTLMARLRELDPDLPVILITGHADVQLAISAIRAGAYDFLEKPFVVQDLVTVIRRACAHRALVLDNRRLRAVAGKRDDVEARLPGRTPVMVDLRHRVRAIGASDADTLIVGPTGSGKEVVARTLHDISARASRPFVAINCAALPEQLIESDLFGHEAGAFPGAIRPRFGRFEHARGGTVLLDEIGAMPLHVQARLLRVLQERCITRLGSHDPIALDVRFVAISKTEPSALVTRGLLREDLYWRLNLAVLHIPPLAGRREDIPLLFLQLIREAAARHSLPERPANPALLADLAARDWPGNIRELRNVAERHVLGLDGVPGEEMTLARLSDRMADFERSVIAGAIAAHGGRLRPVYEALGISRKTLYDKMQRHGLDRRFIIEPDDEDHA